MRPPRPKKPPQRLCYRQTPMEHPVWGTVAPVVDENSIKVGSATHNGKQQTKYCRSSDGMWKLSCRSISQICQNHAPGNRAFNREFTFQQPAQILSRNSRELETAVAENTNLKTA